METWSCDKKRDKTYVRKEEDMKKSLQRAQTMTLWTAFLDQKSDNLKNATEKDNNEHNTPLDVTKRTGLFSSDPCEEAPPAGAPAAKSRPFTKSSPPPNVDLALLLAVFLTLQEEEEVVIGSSPECRFRCTRGLTEAIPEALVLSLEDGRELLCC
jgi:hypothetical protein